MRCAVLGDPIGHSLSPVLHRAGYDVLGLDWAYTAERVGAGGLAPFLDTLDDSWRGLSLTMPLKREAVALGAASSDRVRLTGAANTVVLDGAGGWWLDNTDLPGAAAALRERYDGPMDSVVVLGAGATAASVALAACDLGARSVRLLARSAGRAASTATAVAAHPAGPIVSVGGLVHDRSHPLDLLVSTIPVTAQTPELLSYAVRAAVTFEVLYDPWPTPVAVAAQDAGRTLVGGLDLLVHQAALQFELFTGHGAPLEAMRDAGRAALAARS